jgi:hypothetical protein
MKKVKPKNRDALIITLLFAVGTFLGLFWIYYSSLDFLLKIFVAIAMLAVTSHVIITANNLRHMFDSYLLGSKHGIKLIDSLSKHGRRFWITFADWGLVVSFGLLAYPLFKNQINKKTFVVGLISIFVILFLVIPYSSLAFEFINIPQITSRITQAAQTQPSNNPYAMLGTLMLSLISLVGGYAALIMSLLIYSSWNILYSTAVFLQSLLMNVPNYGVLSSQIPGVAPLIPGLTIPLFAGVVTLVIILVIHEFSHGILSRVAKVKLDEIGVLVFGIVPIGAFVEPNEKQVKKLGKEKQNRIFIAGIAANMLFAIITFVLLMIVINYVLPPFISTKIIISSVVSNSSAYTVNLPIGAQILKWDNYTATNLSVLNAVAAKSDTPFAAISITTDKGLYTLVANDSGKIGIGVNEIVASNPGIISSAVYFVYAVLSLSFLLNFLIAVANLLPIPGFDGWQIYQLGSKNKKILNLLSAITIATLLINVLPWFLPH